MHLVKMIIFADRVTNLTKSLNRVRWLWRPKPAGTWELKGADTGEREGGSSCAARNQGDWGHLRFFSTNKCATE